MSQFEDEEIDEGEFDAIGEDPDDADILRIEKNDLINCPHCGKSNHPEALTCRFCKLFLTDDQHQPRKPGWLRISFIVALVVALICGVIGYSAQNIDFSFIHLHR